MKDRDGEGTALARSRTERLGNDSFEHFCATELPSLRRWLVEYCRRFCRPFGSLRCDPEDLAHDAMLRGIEYIEIARRTQCAISHPKAWLRRIARNVAIDHGRRDNRESPICAEADTSQLTCEPPPVDTADRIDLQFAISQLPERERSIVELFLLGETIGAAAAILGLNTWQTYKRFERAMNKLAIKFRVD